MVSNSLHKLCREKNCLFLEALSVLSTLADLTIFNSSSGVASAFLSKLVTRAGYVNSVFPSVHFISSRNLFICTDFANCAKLSGTQARSRKQQSCLKDELLVSIEGKGLNRDKLSCIYFGGYFAQEAEAVITVSTLEAEYSNWWSRPQN